MASCLMHRFRSVGRREEMQRTGEASTEVLRGVATASLEVPR